MSKKSKPKPNIPWSVRRRFAENLAAKTRRLPNIPGPIIKKGYTVTSKAYLHR